MKPNTTFESIRADEVAECWEGVSDALYKVLWNKVVRVQKNLPNLEDNGPHDLIGFENLASHWDLLTEEEQLELNSLAEKRDREFELQDEWEDYPT